MKSVIEIRNEIDRLVRRIASNKQVITSNRGTFADWELENLMRRLNTLRWVIGEE